MTDRHTDRQTPAILLSVPCYAIAMGQIIKINAVIKMIANLHRQNNTIKSLHVKTTRCIV